MEAKFSFSSSRSQFSRLFANQPANPLSLFTPDDVCVCGFSHFHHLTTFVRLSLIHAFNRLTLAFLLLAATFGTVLDLLLYHTSDIPLSKLSCKARCFLSFSIPRNFVSIFNPDTSESHLACLHGFRVLTMGWVVMGHTYALTNHQAFGE